MQHLQGGGGPETVQEEAIQVVEELEGGVEGEAAEARPRAPRKCSACGSLAHTARKCPERIQF